MKLFYTPDPMRSVLFFSYIIVFLFYLGQRKKMENNCFDTKRKKIFFVLLTLQIVSLILLIVGKEISDHIFTILIRFLILVIANHCLQPTFAIFYSGFCLLSAIYLVDPVGLFLSSHGLKKTMAQNIICIITLVLAIVCSYLGYIFSKQIAIESNNSQQYDDDGGNSFSRPINNPSGYDQRPSQSYGGTNYVYENPNRSSIRQNQHNKKSFVPFEGKSYSLS